MFKQWIHCTESCKVIKYLLAWLLLCIFNDILITLLSHICGYMAILNTWSWYTDIFIIKKSSHPTIQNPDMILMIILIRCLLIDTVIVASVYSPSRWSVNYFIKFISKELYIFLRLVLMYRSTMDGNYQLT